MELRSDLRLGRPARPGGVGVLPLWLALSASLTLHVGVLLAPGWPLPHDDEPPPRLDAVLAVPPLPASPSVPAVKPPARKRPAPKSQPAPTPAAPQANLPEEPRPVETVAPATPGIESPAVAAPESAEPAVPPAPTFAQHWPQKGRIAYQLTRGTDGFVVGRSEQRWEHDAEHYVLHSEMETTGLAALFKPARLELESRGRFDAHGLRPIEFSGQRSGKAAEQIRFAPEEGVIDLGKGGRAPFTAGAQDLLSLFHHVAVLGFDPPEFAVMVATGRKLVRYNGSIGKEETLEIPLGTRQVRKIRLLPEADEETLELWIDMQIYLPIKIRARDRKGEVFDQTAISIETETLP